MLYFPHVQPVSTLPPLSARSGLGFFDLPMKTPGIIAEQVDLSPLTTMRLGGPARYLARCTTADEIRTALEWAAVQGLPVQVLGGGSNTIFDDRGYPGLVLKLELSGVRFEGGGGKVEVSALAGEDWDDLVRRCIARGLSGIECLSGIPGLVGAAPMQNVGAYGQEVAGTITAVRAIDRSTLKQVEFANRQCGFRYRNSRFKSEDRDRYVITEVVFRLEQGVRPELRYRELSECVARRGGLDGLEPGEPASSAVRAAVLDLRRSKSMVLDPGDPNTRSVGSFFLNPVLSEAELSGLRRRCLEAPGEQQAPVPVFPDPGGHKVPAAWLVERAGFRKGQRLGGAAVSENHALALVNRGGGSADVLKLAAAIQQQVEERFGIRLEREPVVVSAEGAVQ